MMQKCVIVGAGGHARSVASSLLRKNEFQIQHIVDIAHLPVLNKDEKVLGIPVLSSSDLLKTLEQLKIKNIFIAIGDNQKRKALYAQLKNQGYLFPNHIAITATLCQEVQLGDGNIILENTFVGPLCKIGSNNILNSGSVFEHESILGSHSHLGPNSSVAGRVTLGDLVFMGIGSATIPNLKIGNEVILGAGSTFIRNVERPGVYVGVPAQFKKDFPN